MFICPECRATNTGQTPTCWNCSTELQRLSPSEKAAREGTTVEEQLAERFRCPKCESARAGTSRIATTGTSFSRLFDIQHSRFLVVWCSHCGFAEFYNLDVLEGSSDLGAILDILF